MRCNVNPCSLNMGTGLWEVEPSEETSDNRSPPNEGLKPNTEPETTGDSNRVTNVTSKCVGESAAKQDNSALSSTSSLTEDETLVSSTQEINDKSREQTTITSRSYHKKTSESEVECSQSNLEYNHDEENERSTETATKDRIKVKATSEETINATHEKCKEINAKSPLEIKLDKLLHTQEESKASKKSEDVSNINENNAKSQEQTNRELDVLPRVNKNATLEDNTKTNLVQITGKSDSQNKYSNTANSDANCIPLNNPVNMTESSSRDLQINNLKLNDKVDAGNEVIRKQREDTIMSQLPKSTDRENEQSVMGKMLSSSSIKNINQDMGSSQDFKCNKCNFKGKKLVMLVSHYVNNHPDVEIPVRLNKNEFEIESGHEDLTNTGQPSGPDTSWIPNETRFPHSIECKYCDFPASRRSLMLAHVGSHYDTNGLLIESTFKIYNCRFCSIPPFKTINEFKDHVTSHTGEFMYNCPYCSNKYHSGLILKNHISVNHLFSKPKEITQSYDMLGGSVVYGHLCTGCGFVQLNESNVLDHVKHQHEGEDVNVIKINMSGKAPATEPKAQTSRFSPAKYGSNLQDRFHRPKKLNAAHVKSKFTSLSLIKPNTSTTHKNTSILSAESEIKTDLTPKISNVDDQHQETCCSSDIAIKKQENQFDDCQDGDFTDQSESINLEKNSPMIAQVVSLSSAEAENYDWTAMEVEETQNGDLKCVMKNNDEPENCQPERTNLNVCSESEDAEELLGKSVSQEKTPVPVTCSIDPQQTNNGPDDEQEMFPGSERSGNHSEELTGTQLQVDTTKEDASSTVDDAPLPGSSMNTKLHSCGYKSCFRKSAKLDSLKVHMIKYKHASGRMVCVLPKCKRHFNKIEIYIAHLADHVNKRFFCSLCSYQASMPAFVKRHFIASHNVKRVKHLVCYPKEHNSTDPETGEFVVGVEDNFQTISPSDCTLIPRQHVFLKYVKCSECSYCTKYNSTFFKHLATHQKQKERDETIENNNNIPEDNEHSSVNQTQEESQVPQYIPECNLFKCWFQDCTFTDLKDPFFIHLKKYHSKEISYNCQHCNCSFEALNKLIKHLLLHGPTLFKCAQCSYYNCQEWVVKRHANKLHSMKSQPITIRKFEPIENRESCQVKPTKTGSQSKVIKRNSSSSLNKEETTIKCNVSPAARVETASENDMNVRESENPLTQVKQGKRKSRSKFVKEMTVRSSDRRNFSRPGTKSTSEINKNTVHGTTLEASSLKSPLKQVSKTTEINKNTVHGTTLEASSLKLPLKQVSKWKRKFNQDLNKTAGEQQMQSDSLQLETQTASLCEDGVVTTNDLISNITRVDENYNTNQHSTIGEESDPDALPATSDNEALGLDLPSVETTPEQNKNASPKPKQMHTASAMEKLSSVPQKNVISKHFFTISKNIIISKNKNPSSPRKTYKCTLCENYEAKYKPRMRAHLMDEVDYRNQYCTLCEYTCTTSRWLKRHYEFDHEGEPFSGEVRNCPEKEQLISDILKNILSDNCNSEIKKIEEYEDIPSETVKTDDKCSLERKVIEQNQEMSNKAVKLDDDYISKKNCKNYILEHMPIETESRGLNSSANRKIIEEQIDDVPKEEIKICKKRKIKEMVKVVPNEEVQGCSYKKKRKIIERVESASQDSSHSYHCFQCSFVTDSTNGFRNHMYRHYGYKPACCLYCDNKYSLRRINSHIITRHPGNKVKYHSRLNFKLEKKVALLIKSEEGQWTIKGSRSSSTCGPPMSKKLKKQNYSGQSTDNEWTRTYSPDCLSNNNSLFETTTVWQEDDDKTNIPVIGGFSQCETKFGRTEEVFYICVHCKERIESADTYYHWEVYHSHLEKEFVRDEVAARPSTLQTTGAVKQDARLVGPSREKKVQRELLNTHVESEIDSEVLSDSGNAGFSFYGCKPEPVDLSSIKTTILDKRSGARIKVSYEIFSKLNLDARVVVEDYLTSHQFDLFCT